MDEGLKRGRGGPLLLGAGYATLGLAYLAWTWSGDVADLGGDSSMYLLMARRLSPFVPHPEVLELAVRGAVYPPLFPLLLGLLGGDMLAAHLLVTACLLAALPCLYAWLRAEGMDRPASAWAAALFALMPGTYFLAQNIWTENSYLLLSLVAILAERRAEGAAPRRLSLHWVAAAAVAAATLTRAAALPLLLAFLLRMLLLRPRHWTWLMMAAVLPFLLWAGWSGAHQAGVSGYAGPWLAAYAEHPWAALAAQLGRESGLAGIAWVLGWVGPAEKTSVLVWAAAAFGLLCLLGCAGRLVRLRFDAVYAVLYLALLLAWPFPAEGRRLSYVLVPVLLAQGLLLLQALRGGAARPLLPAVQLLLTLLLLPNLLLTWQRFHQPMPAALEPARHTERFYADDLAHAQYDAEEFTGTLNGLRDVARLVPEGECFFATKPSTATLYSGRLSLPPPGSAVADGRFAQEIGGCRYAWLVPATSPSFDQPMYPLDRLGRRAQTLYAVKDSDGFTFGVLVRIDPP